MTTLVTPSPDTTEAAPPQKSGAATFWRKVRTPVAVLAVVALIGVLLSLGDEQFPGGHLEPESVRPDGTRALVQVLREDREVTVARSSSAAETALTGAEDAVLVVFLDHRLLPSELEELAGLGVDTVLIQPSLHSLNAFAPGVDMTGRVEDDDPLEPHCDLPTAVEAGTADVGGEIYRATPGLSTQECYPAEGGVSLLQVEKHGSSTTVLGTGLPLTNGHLADEGNAALALNLTDADTVVWLRPDPPQQEGSASLWELIPEGVRWSLVPLVALLALLALWRGRRLGALVPESLPVVVRASETTEGRARLYRSRKARDRAAAALRSGFLERSLPRIGLRPDASPDAVVSALAQRLGEDPQTLQALLHPSEADPYTGDDEGTARLAEALDELARRLR